MSALGLRANKHAPRATHGARKSAAAAAVMSLQPACAASGRPEPEKTRCAQAVGYESLSFI